MHLKKFLSPLTTAWPYSSSLLGTVLVMYYLQAMSVYYLSGEGELADVKPMSGIMLRNTEDISQCLSKCLRPILLTITDAIRDTRLQLISVESFI